MITVNEDIGVEIEAKVNAEAEIDAFVFIGSGGTPDGIDGGEADTEFPEPTEDPWLSQIQIRRDVLADWVSANPVLRFGEFGFVSDEKYLVIGDGASDFNTIVGDDENIYETKKYVDDLVDNVYNTYDFVIGELISASSQHESDIANIKQSLPKFKQIPIGDCDGINVDFETPTDYQAGSLMVFKGGPRGRALIDIIEDDSPKFSIADAPEDGEDLICQYIEKV